jgi:hypothetical protein
MAYFGKLLRYITQTVKSQWVEAELPNILEPTLSKVSKRHIDSLIRPVTMTFHTYSMIARNLYWTTSSARSSKPNGFSQCLVSKQD